MMSHHSTISLERPSTEREDEKTVPVTVLLVEDHEIVRKGLRSFLDACPQVAIVGEAGDASSAVKAVIRYRPDVVLIDLTLPLYPEEHPTIQAGIRAVRCLCRASPHSQVIVLTDSGREELIAMAIQGGALACLLKEGDAQTVLHAILAAGRGETTIHPHTARYLVTKAVAPSQHVGPRVRLTSCEIEILELAAKGHTHAKIACELAIAEHIVIAHLTDVLTRIASQYSSSHIKYQGENTECPSLRNGTLSQ
jgi:NarL family two-component system response regulator LiaR